MPTDSSPQLVILAQLDKTNRAQLQSEMTVFTLVDLYLGHEYVQMLDILLSAVILHKPLSSSAFVDDEKNCYGESHEEAETDHK